MNAGISFSRMKVIREANSSWVRMLCISLVMLPEYPPSTSYRLHPRETVFTIYSRMRSYSSEIMHTLLRLFRLIVK